MLLVHRQSPRLARHLAEAFTLAAERLADFPRLGIATDTADTRFLLVAGGRYRLIYRLEDKALRIHGISSTRKPWQTGRP